MLFVVKMLLDEFFFFMNNNIQVIQGVKKTQAMNFHI